MNRTTDYAALTRMGMIVCTFDNPERAHEFAEARGLIVHRRTVTFSPVDRAGRFVAVERGASA